MPETKINQNTDQSGPDFFFRKNARIFSILCAIIFCTNTSYPAGLELYGTFNAMGIIVSINASDDPDQDASSAVQYRISGQSYSPGFPLTRVADNRFVGSLFWLVAATGYDVRVTFSDPDHGPIDGLVLQSTQATQNEPVVPNANHTFYVTPNGNGSACSEGSPCSLNSALNLAVAGDQIVLRQGTYYTGEIDIPRSGSLNSPIVIKGYDNEDVIFDGGDPNSYSWTLLAGGVYSTTVNAADPHLVVADGQRLYPYQSLADLQNLVWGIPGFYANGTTVYVRLQNNASPNNREMVVSRYNHCFFIEQDYIALQNLTFRHYGCGSYAKALYFNNASNNLIENCTFAINDLGIGIKRDSHRNLIQDNEFYDTDFDWPWDAVKSGSELETGGVRFYDPMTGRGNVIRRNIFHDYFDGFGVSPEYTAGITNETDVYENTIYRVGDDGVEVDGQASNVRLWNNTFHDVLMGISVAPVYTGPVYALYNTIYNTGVGNNDYSGSPFKFNSGYDRSGTIYLFHNTCSAQLADNNGLYIKSPGEWDLIFSRNNIWDGTDYAIDNYNTGQPTDFDYDCLWTTGSGLVRWNDAVYNTIAAFHTGTGQEPSAIKVNPQFVNAGAGNFQLAVGSGLIDAGLSIPGINDHYAGAAPDIGAYESQTTSSVRLSVKIWLEGAFRNNAMHTKLNDAGLIPLTSPYVTAPRTVASIPQNCVDWILLELRSTPDGAADYTQSFFLKNNGAIVGMDGATSELALADVDEGNYYIVVRHRNHLSVMSSSAVQLNKTAAAHYDFTTSAAQFYGTNGAKQIQPGAWGMWAGNSNSDNVVNSDDFQLWHSDAKNGAAGYQGSDYNLDSFVTSADYVYWFNNQFLGAGSAIP